MSPEQVPDRHVAEQIATGRSAQVYAMAGEPERVVKLFAADYPAALIDAEQAACEEASALGATPIRCHGQVRLAEQTGLVFDRIHGVSLTTMAEDNPLRLRESARILARQHVKLHSASTTKFLEVREAAIQALDTEPLYFLSSTQREEARLRIERLPAGDSLLHLDFHTENVFSHDGHYVVIDWQSALRGDRAADVAMTVLLIRDAELWPGTPLLKRLLIQLVRRVVLATYLKEYLQLTGLTRAQVDAWRIVALVLRMSTLDIASERERFRAELVELLAVNDQ